MRVLLDPCCKIPTGLLVVPKTSPVEVGAVSARHDTTDVGKHTERSQMAYEDIFNEPLFRLTFGDDMQPRHAQGVPPRTFFSHRYLLSSLFHPSRMRAVSEVL